MKFSLVVIVVSALAVGSSGCNCAGAPADSEEGEDGGTPDPTDGGPGDGGVSPLLDTSYGEDGVARAPNTWSTDTVYAAARAGDGTITVGGTTLDFARSSQLLIGRFTAAGTPDTSFGEGGHVKIPLLQVGEVTGLAVLPSGAVVLSGTAHATGATRAFAARLTAQGELDASFGEAGVVLWEGRFRSPTAVAAGDDGRILVASQGSSNASLQCLNVDGSSGAEVELAGDEPRALVVLDDGKILALTADNNDSSWLERFNPDCTADSSFADGGVYALDFIADDIAVDPAGSDLLVAGGRLVMLTADGALDESFVSASGGRALAWLPSGDIFLVDAAGNLPDLTTVGLIRLGADGAPLPFDGSAAASLHDRPTRVLASNDGVLWVGAELTSIDTPARKDQRMSVMAFAPDGAADVSFGDAGRAHIASGGGSEAMWDMVRSADGSIIVAATAGAHSTFMRFVDGQLDPTFGVDGFVRNYFGFVFALRADSGGGLIGLNPGGVLARRAADGSEDAAFVPAVLPGQIRDLVLDASGRIVVSGGVYGDGIEVDVLVARYNADGSLDASFGTGGVVQGLDGENSWASSVYVDVGGRIVISGEYYPSGEIFCARFNADGALDDTFGEGGVAALVGTHTINDLSRIVARRAGGLLVATRSVLGDVIDVFALDDNGTPIAGFGVDGVAAVAADGDGPFDMLELEDGRILVAKSVQGPRTVEMMVWSLRPDGQVDTGFGDDGRFVFAGQGHAVRLLPDGDGVLVGGYTFNAATGTDVALLRITP